MKPRNEAGMRGIYPRRPNVVVDSSMKARHERSIRPNLLHASPLDLGESSPERTTPEGRAAHLVPQLLPVLRVDAIQVLRTWVRTIAGY